MHDCCTGIRYEPVYRPVLSKNFTLLWLLFFLMDTSFWCVIIYFCIAFDILEWFTSLCFIFKDHPLTHNVPQRQVCVQDRWIDSIIIYWADISQTLLHHYVSINCIFLSVLLLMEPCLASFASLMLQASSVWLTILSFKGWAVECCCSSSKWSITGMCNRHLTFGLWKWCGSATLDP